MKKYHIRRQDREIEDANEITEILKNGKYTTISLCQENEPYIVTLNYGYDEKRSALYFHAALEGTKLEFMRKNPKVCATVIDDRGYVMDECEHLYRSVVFRGKMSIIEELDEKKHGMEILLEHLEDNPEPIRERNFPDDRRYEKVAILKLEIEKISGKKNCK